MACNHAMAAFHTRLHSAASVVWISLTTELMQSCVRSNHTGREADLCLVAQRFHNSHDTARVPSRLANDECEPRQQSRANLGEAADVCFCLRSRAYNHRSLPLRLLQLHEMYLFYLLHGGLAGQKHSSTQCDPSLQVFIIGLSH